MIMIFTLYNKIRCKRSENGQLGCASLYEMMKIDGIEHISTEMDLHIYNTFLLCNILKLGKAVGNCIKFKAVSIQVLTAFLK